MSSTSELIAQQLASAVNVKKIWGFLPNPKEYGAKGDGTPDDTSSFQDCVDYCNVNGGKVVLCPPGTYYVTALTNDEGIIFVGDNASFVGGYEGEINSIGKSAEELSMILDHGNNIDIIHRMSNGETVKILCYGDSVTYGDLGGSRAAIPYPARLETVLRDHYDNANITVVNKGVNGRQTDEALANFDAVVLPEEPDLIIIMFGINDASGSITPMNTIDQYKSNITQMVEKSKNNGIEVLLMNPTPVAHTNYKNQGGNTRIYRFGQAMKEIANKYNISYLDLNKIIYDIYLSKSKKIYDLQGNDYVHFTEEGYKFLGDIVFNYAFNLPMTNSVLTIDKNKIITIPIVNSVFVKTDMGSFVNINAAQFWRRNYLMYMDNSQGTYLTFEFFMNVSGMDLYLVSPKSYIGGTVTVLDNGVEIGDIDFYHPEGVVYDSKKTIIKNLSVGYHKIEFLSSNIVAGQTAEANPGIYFSYFSIEPTTVLDPNKIVTGSASTRQFNKIVDGSVHFLGGVGEYTQSILFDSPLLETLPGKTLVIEAEGKLYDKSGIMWFGNKAGNNNTKGYNNGYILLFGATTVSLFAPNGLDNAIVQIGNSATALDFAEDHEIRIEHSSAGLIKVIIDGTELISVTNTAVNSGYFGLYSQNIATTQTMKLKRTEYAHI